MPSDDRFADAMRELRQFGAGQGGRVPPIEPPLPRDDGDGMEPRVKRLEDDVRAIRSDLTVINGRLSNVEGKLDMLIGQVSEMTKQVNALATQGADLAGQMRSLSAHVAAKVPGTWQLLALIVGTFAAMGSLGLAFAKAAQWLKIIPA